MALLGLGLQRLRLSLQRLHALQLGVQAAVLRGALRSVCSAGARPTHHSSATPTTAAAAPTQQLFTRGQLAAQRAFKAAWCGSWRGPLAHHQRIAFAAQAR
jgi:hypothetical protein